MKWLLIMYLVGPGVHASASVTAEFSSEPQCLAAITAMEAEAATYRDPYPPSVLAVCVEK